MENAMTRHSAYVPLLIGLVALAAWLLLQDIEMWQVRGVLIQEREGQTNAMVESNKMRQQLNALASRTAELAQKGDPDAKAIIDAYAKRGLTFVPPKAPGAAPAPAAKP